MVATQICSQAGDRVLVSLFEAQIPDAISDRSPGTAVPPIVAHANGCATARPAPGRANIDAQTRPQAPAVWCLALLERPVELDLGARVFAIACRPVLLLNLHVDLGPMHPNA